MKKIFPILLILLAVGGGMFWMVKKKSEPTAEEPGKTKRRIEEPVNVIAIEDRPYLKIVPHADGRNLTLAINELKKPAISVDYELEYQAGSLLQGAFGQLSLNSLPAREQILLGSCSAGGACTYHEDVHGGTLLTRFEGPEAYALKSRWKYIINSEGESAHSSQDAKFQIESQVLTKQSYIVIFNNAGYPGEVERQVVSEIYSLTTAGDLNGIADLTIRAEEEGELTIMGYDGTKWQEFETTVDSKMASAEVELMELYLVVK